MRTGRRRPLTAPPARAQVSSAETFLRAPDVVYNFAVHENRYVSVAVMLLKLDPRLDSFRLRCVPAK